MRRFQLNLNIWGFIIFFKLYFLMNAFALLYLFDTGRTEMAYKGMLDMATSIWFFAAIIIYWIGELIWDMVEHIRSKREAKE